MRKFTLKVYYGNIRSYGPKSKFERRKNNNMFVGILLI